MGARYRLCQGQGVGVPPSQIQAFGQDHRIAALICGASDEFRSAPEIGLRPSGFHTHLTHADPNPTR